MPHGIAVLISGPDITQVEGLCGVVKSSDHYCISMKHAAFAIASFAVLGSCAYGSRGARALTLKAAYANAFRIGSAINPEIVSGRDSLSQRIVIQQLNTITAENVMKAATLNPRPGVFDYAEADAFVALGLQHNMFIVGHTLVWHNSTPSWFLQSADGKANPRATVVENLRQYIEAVGTHFKGRVHAWDVVNEVVAEDGSYRPTTWVNAIGNGDSLVKLSFRFARQYAPGTELYYNEFNAERPTKRDGIVRLVRMLKKEGIRIDGVGIQAHWGLNYPRTDYIEAAIDSFAALGVKVMITELDVDVLPLTREGQIIGQSFSEPQFQLEEFKKYLDPFPSALPDSVQQVLARRYAELFEIFYRKRDKIDRVTFWGVHDGMSWKNGYPIPNRTNYPLLFDRNRQPKPAFAAVLGVPGRLGNSK
ncbi:MAG: endo-1,4-beta-xylanase [Gemmatimonadaceae bacterium]